MQVIKYSGEIEKFSTRKIHNTIREAGGSSKLANDAIREVKKKYHRNITTKEILEILLNFLKKEPGVSERYNLKRGIMDLGPTGFPFEKYFSKILEHYGFKTKVGTKIKGKKIYHEVDIIAEKDKKFMIECKYHNELGTTTRLHPAMYTYARFLDLKRHKFDKGWLVTNTKCSEDAKLYAKGTGLKITSWKYPKNQSLQKLIEKKNLYPITILMNITPEIKEKLFEHDILTIKDFEKYSEEELKHKLNISEEKTKEILKEVYEIL